MFENLYNLHGLGDEQLPTRERSGPLDFSAPIQTSNSIYRWQRSHADLLPHIIHNMNPYMDFVARVACYFLRCDTFAGDRGVDNWNLGSNSQEEKHRSASTEGSCSMPTARIVSCLAERKWDIAVLDHMLYLSPH